MRSRADGTPALVHVPELAGPGEMIRLSETESRYVTRVCRVRPNERVRATDGRGGLASLRIETLGAHVIGRVESVEQVQRTRRAWVITGAPERGREDWLVEKLAELGVERWIPIHCARERWTSSRSRLERWGRIAVAAMRQSLSAHRMSVDEPLDLAAAVEQIPKEAERWLASIEGESMTAEPTGPLDVAAIGPAPGWAPEEELRLVSAGFRPVRLAPQRLRVETAAVCWAARWAGSATERPVHPSG